MIQGTWNALEVMHSLAEGELPAGFQGVDRSPSQELQEQAREALLNERVLVVKPGERTDPLGAVSVLSRLLAELDIGMNPSETGRWVSVGFNQRWLPGEAEALLDNEQVRAHPHLAAARMLRLAKEGGMREVIDLLPAVRETRHCLRPSKAQAAEALVLVAHGLLDSLREFFGPMRTLAMEASSEGFRWLAPCTSRR